MAEKQQKNLICASDRSVFLVKGNSMRPVLRTGDRVELHPAERSALCCGDILVFTAADGREIIHRVVRLSPLQTRGDNCVADDFPVPESSPLFRACSFRRNGKRMTLSSGAAGFREFHRDQFRRKLLDAVRKIVAPAAGRNCFRIPFRKLSKCVFPGKTVYYAGKYPVGYRDEKGWHWMRFTRYFVEAPPEDRHE